MRLVLSIPRDVEVFIESVARMKEASAFPEQLIFLALLLFAGCGGETIEQRPASLPERTVAEVSEGIPLERLSQPSSEEATTQAIMFSALPVSKRPEFSYFNGSRGKRLMLEATGGGCGWLEIDGDGYCDLYLVQGGVPDEPAGHESLSDQLWRNFSERFVDVTAVAGFRETGFGQGVTIGDFDNDGFDDIFVTNVGRNTLFQGLGDGTFLEVVQWGGEDSKVWSTSAAWADTDLDGDLDLYVCNYVDFDPFHPQICVNETNEQIQCAPNQVTAVADEFYVNNGDGSFSASAEALGFFGPENRGLGVIVLDLVGDHFPEVYVANDATANFLFQRGDDGRYADRASLLGCALDANGLGQASMGITAGDYDRDGLMDLYLTHFEGEWNTLYHNGGDFGFKDVTAEVQAVQSTLPWVGFGVVMEDFDQNGADDIFVTNGHIDDRGRKQVLEMRPQLLSFQGKLLREVSAESGEYFSLPLIGRGCSQADFDNDGGFDIAVVHHNRVAEILHNQSERGHWLAVELIGTRSNRRGLGAKVVVRQSATTLVQQLYGGGSYCSSRQYRLIFGLAECSEPCEIEIRWPDGTVEHLAGVQIDQKIVIKEKDHNG